MRRTLLAPLLGSEAAATEGSPEWILEQGRKDRTESNPPVIAKPVRKLAVAIRIPCVLHQNPAHTKGETDSHVAALLGMTEVFCT